MRSIIFHGQTGKFTFRMLAVVLGGQSICILLARSWRGRSRRPTVATRRARPTSSSASVSAPCASWLQDSCASLGVTLGWVVQALTLLSALVVPMMLVVGSSSSPCGSPASSRAPRSTAEMARRQAAAGGGDAADRVDG